jgi:hypothetical protein
LADSQTWLNQGIPLHIDNDVTISASGGVSLSIQYGSVLKFEAQKALRVGHTSSSTYWGRLNATGVDFIGTTDVPGHWLGLIYNSYSDGGTLSGCTIKNAGYGTSIYRTLYINTLQTMPQQTITGCDIIDGLGTGVYISNNSRPAFSGNTISGHSEYPLSIYANDVGLIGLNNDFTGNTYDIIEVRAGIIAESQIWRNHFVPYLFTDSFSIYGTSNPHLQIMPDCIIQLKNEKYIQIGHTSASSYISSMEAEGVTFTRANEGDFHRGLYFANWSNDELCKLTDCIIEYGGNSTTYNAGITITQSAPVFNHVTFRNNLGYGLRINDITEGDPLPEVINCRFYDNSEYPIKIHASELSCLKEDNVYSGNNPDEIHVTGDPINYDAEWINQGIPYDIDGSITLSNPEAPHLIINSGFVLKFGSGDYLSVGHVSAATYLGSIEAKGVTFTGKTNTPGDWTGIRFLRYANYDLTILDKCAIEYATTNIYCSSGNPFIKQSVISNALNYGIYASGSLCNFNIFSNSIYNNDIGIYCTSSANPVIGGETGNANSMVNNTTYGVQNNTVGTSLNATYNWWGDETGPYNADTNELGLGNTASNYIDFSNFLTSPLSEAPSLFDLLSPALADTIWSYDTLLDWETSIDPTPDDELKYRLEVSATSSFSPETTTVIDDIDESHYLLSDTIIDDDTRYWWRVTAYDLVGLETNCNQQNWYFDVFVVEPPNPFTLLSPAHQATVNETSVLLAWQEANDPDPGDSVFYTVYLDVTASFSEPDSVVTSETAVYTPFCQPGGLYYWTVKATDTYGKSAFAGIRSFYVDTSAGPRKPEWVNIGFNGPHVELTWEAVPGADSYIIEKANDNPSSGFTVLDTSLTNNYIDINGVSNQQKSFYRVIAVDDDLRKYWRNVAGDEIK